jgi:glycogen debranching enzyme
MIELSVGPPALTINHGSTFMVTDLRGEIAADSAHGLFTDDTRFLSYYALFANGQPWVLLTSATPSHYAARVYLTNSHFKTEDSAVEAGTLALVVERTIGEGLHEDLSVTNHGPRPVRFNLELALRCDFADIFEVKAHEFVRRGRIVTEWDEKGGALATRYTNRDFSRTLVYRVIEAGSGPSYANGRLTFDIALDAGATWHARSAYVLECSGRVRAPEAAANFDTLHQEWLDAATRLTSSNEEVYRLYRQSVADMGALRLFDHDFAHDVWVPAAGVPWFVTVFGRDSLVVSLQNMMVNAGFARGALRKLAALQATERDDWRDAEPGKISHEIRLGELAHFHRIPHTPYYGTADATPLYLIALHETWKWLGDSALLREYRDVALRCLEWIDRYGDLDGDGFQEYRTRSPVGYENLGWKDAADAVVYPDGRQVRPPKALCELQGYVFDAWLRMAEVFDGLGEADRAHQLREKARHLRARFEDRFWCDDLGFYAFALDAQKEPVKTIASNAGHLLWSGLVDPARAAQVVRRLLEPDMWSGWGIRTLSSRNPAYNPLAYQRGSVWPHDNGIIALGFKRYGFAAEAARVARDISEAASCFESHRLPELYAGLERRPGSFPVQYLGANVPQAWAAGSAFHLLQALLGLRADAPHGQLYVDPDLPGWLPDVTLRGLAVGSSRIDVRFWRENERTRWDVLDRQGDVELIERAWHPWTIKETDQQC